jgi:hypothetical protein
MVDTRNAVLNHGSTIEGTGPLTRRVLGYTETIERLVPTVTSSADWAALAEYVAVEEFERVGTFLEVQDWQQYVEMLTRWASATDAFETRVRRVSELPGLVYLEVEEGHVRGGTASVVNSMTVFEFDEVGRIRHLNVYLQQRR